MSAVFLIAVLALVLPGFLSSNNGVKQFVEIGPGKVLSGLIKRIDSNVKISAINNEEDINIFKI